jgi:hypothetical protein
MTASETPKSTNHGYWLASQHIRVVHHPREIDRCMRLVERRIAGYAAESALIVT